MNLATVGVTGTYPNGGYPLQAFYSIAGALPASASGAPGGGSSGSSVALPANPAMAVGLLLLLLIGAYALWHFTY